MGSYVFVIEMMFIFCDVIFICMGVRDNFFVGELIFMVEVSEIVFIFCFVILRSLVILDELGRGMLMYDGVVIVYVVLDYVVKEVGCLILFIMYY